MLVRLMAAAAAAAVLSFCPAAVASPVATSDTQYQALGRVFPDPLAGCQRLATSPCSPNAQGNVPAGQFIQYGEFLDAVKYMNQRSEWQRHMEVWALDGRLGDGSGTGLGADAFPGNNLGKLEFSPKGEYQSAGLPTTTLDRKKSDLIVVRVTDESVPDAGKKRYALSLSIHGIERAGLEGGTRAIEDLVTAHTTGLASRPVVPAGVETGAPTFGDVLKKTIIYFTYPNPDGWRRGSISEGGVFFQRYNGNGVDPNRDWPDIGFSFRPYSGMSEPETRAFAGFYQNVKQSTGAQFAAGDDLHGQPFADALSFTLLPHGKHDFGKDLRIRETAKTIHRASEAALSWSPIIQPNDAPKGGGLPCAPNVALGEMCAKIYGQTWGTVYDTINYTTTGALGDWFDSSVGLGADGIDNEMSFSHLDKNIVFDPHTEQLHVDGNKALIYAHLAEIVAPATGTFSAPGRKGFVPNRRLVRKEKAYQSGPPPHTVAQDDISGRTGTADADGNIVFPFEVQRTKARKGQPGIYNGGMRVDVTVQNLQGIATGTATLKVQCKGCDEHVGVIEDEDWVTVQEDYNQSLIYAQAGLTAALNRPDALKADGTPVEWRAVVNGPTATARMDIDFTSGPASIDGSTGGDPPPVARGYDVANTDFFGDLNRFIPSSDERFGAVDPRNVIKGKQQSLSGLRSLVLADDPLPGYTGPYGAEPPRPSGPPTANKQFASTVSVPGVGSRVPGTYETYEFSIGPNDGNGAMTVKIEWDTSVDDFDLYVYSKDADGNLTEVNHSAGGAPQTSETVTVKNPAAGDYVVFVDNWAAPDPRWRGSVTFTPPEAGGVATGTGAYTPAEQDKWFAKLRTWVEGGGNLVLTDGALRALPELVSIPAGAVGRQTVYAGQTAFADADSGDDTLDDPLARDMAQDGARFGSGMRRQTFEPTPLGFAIQDPVSGDDQSHARQYDVDKAAFKAAGGRVAGSSVDAGARNAQAVYSRVALGEIRLGAGAIRIAGALLPQASNEWDHTLGLEPYAVTYTGYILARNLVMP
jgi:hypothetical protein